MSRRFILIATGCVAALAVIMLLIAIFAGGLNKRTREIAAAESRNFAEAQRRFSSYQRYVDDFVKKEQDLFKAVELDERWKKTLDEAKSRMDEAAEKEKKLNELVRENDDKQRAKIEQLAGEISALRTQVLAEASAVEGAAKQLDKFKGELDDQLPKMKENYEAIKDFEFADLDKIVRKAADDWPAKKTDLDNRLKAYTDSKTNMESLWKETEKPRTLAREGKFGEFDITKLVDASRRIVSTKTALEKAKPQLEGLIDQLYWSWDKSLIDMDIQEGAVVTFRQKFRTVRVRAVVTEGVEAASPKEKTPPAETKTAKDKEKKADDKKPDDAKKPDDKKPASEPPAEQKVTDVWQTVTKTQFEKMKNNLGMVVEHKPAGKYDHESIKTLQPPGYAYMASPNQERNRYGHWERRGGSSFWVFYGQYAFMRNMFWGPSYAAVTPRMYHDYDTYRRSGRTYYGRDRLGRTLYGSAGAATKTKLAGSKYVSTGGFKSTKYVQSGGTYRGSRYQARSTTRTRYSSSGSSRSYRSSSSSRSRSSFGGK